VLYDEAYLYTFLAEHDAKVRTFSNIFREKFSVAKTEFEKCLVHREENKYYSRSRLGFDLNHLAGA